MVRQTLAVHSGPLGALLARVHARACVRVCACASTVCACRVLCVRTPRERMSVCATGGRHMASRSLDRTRQRGGLQNLFLLLARHVMSARLHLPPAKSDPIRRQDRARDNRAMRTVAKQPHLYMPLPTPSTNCSCPRLQEKDLCFRGMMLVKHLMCPSILFKKLFMLSSGCVNN